MSGKSLLYLLAWGFGSAVFKFILYSRFLQFTLASKLLLLCTPLVFFLCCYGATILAGLKGFFVGLIGRKGVVASLGEIDNNRPGCALFFIVCLPLSCLYGAVIVLLSHKTGFPFFKMMGVELASSLIWTVWARKKSTAFIDDATSPLPGG